MSTKYNNAKSFYDLLFNMVLLFATLFILTVTMVKVKQNEAQVVSKAEYLITVEWDKDVDYDVDTYVEDPLGNICYFKAQDVGLLTLDRDDVGFRNDYFVISGGKRVEYKENRELVSLRGIVEGEYTVNLHLYHKAESAGPIMVRVKLEKMNPYSLKTVKEVELEQVGDERTVFRFILDDKGEMIDMNDLPKRFTSRGLNQL